MQSDNATGPYLGAAAASIEAEYIQRAELSDHGLAERTAGGERGQVERRARDHDLRAGGLAADRLRGAHRVVLEARARRHDDRVAAARQDPGDVDADAPGAAGDERCLPGARGVLRRPRLERGGEELRRRAAPDEAPGGNIIVTSHLM